MDLGISNKVAPHKAAVRGLEPQKIALLKAEYLGKVGGDGGRFVYTARITEILESLKTEVQKRGLWSFWLTDS